MPGARLACLKGAQSSFQASCTAPIACSYCSCFSAAVACRCFPAPFTALQVLPADALLFTVQLPCCCLQMLPPPSEVGKVGQHRMEVRGLLPPWVVTRLVSAIAAAHDQPWQVCGALSRAHTSLGTGWFPHPRVLICQKDVDSGTMRLCMKHCLPAGSGRDRRPHRQLQQASSR